MVHLIRWTLVTLFAGLAAGALMLGCDGGEYEPAETTEAQDPQSMPPSAKTQTESETEMVPTRAAAQLMSKSGSDLTGEAHFVEDRAGSPSRSTSRTSVRECTPCIFTRTRLQHGGRGYGSSLEPHERESRQVGRRTVSTGRHREHRCPGGWSGYTLHHVRSLVARREQRI